VPDHTTLTLIAAEPLEVGAKVTVSLPERQLLLGALVVYGVPLAAVLAGGAAGAAVFGSDAAAAAGAAGAFAVALWSAASLRRRIERATMRHLVVGPAV
jgi:positive regulator of sigma E activity